jgi:hypothetical protein
LNILLEVYILVLHRLMQIEAFRILTLEFWNKERAIFSGAKAGLDEVVLELELLQGEPANHGFFFSGERDIDRKLVLIVA